MQYAKTEKSNKIILRKLVIDKSTKGGFTHINMKKIQTYLKKPFLPLFVMVKLYNTKWRV